MQPSMVRWSMWFSVVPFSGLCGSGLWSRWFSVVPFCGLGGSVLWSRWFRSVV